MSRRPTVGGNSAGPHEHPAEETVYSCSPHRVEMLGRLVRDDYLPKEGNAVLALLPDWVH